MLESTQSKVVAYSAGLYLLIHPLFLGLGIAKTTSTTAAIVVGLVIFVISLLVCWITVFDTNCLVQGQCNIWAWIMVVIRIIFFAANILIAVLFYIQARKGAITFPSKAVPSETTKASTDSNTDTTTNTDTKTTDEATSNSNDEKAKTS